MERATVRSPLFFSFFLSQVEMFPRICDNFFDVIIPLFGNFPYPRSLRSRPNEFIVAREEIVSDFEYAIGHERRC